MPKNSLGKLYLGTSGLILPVPNKAFYPEEYREKSRLCYYSSLMNSIEINSSFYKIPMAKTVAKWATEVGDNFRFTFKLFREITHNKGLFFDPQLLETALQVMNAVGEKKGCLLIQFPGSIRYEHFPQLQTLIQFLKTYLDPNWNIAIEFRHNSWYRDRVYDLLNDHYIGLVLQDKPPAITPMIDMEANFVYLRFHGPNGNYRRSYPENVLYEYAEYITDWINHGKNVYCYFNNTMGDAFDNLQTLKQAVNALEG